MNASTAQTQGSRAVEYLITQASIPPNAVTTDPNGWTYFVAGEKTTLRWLGDQGWRQCDRYPEPEAGGMITVVFLRERVP